MTRRRPMSEEAYHILLTLREADSYGYAIMQRIAERTGGDVELLPGALYRHLHRFLTAGWVEELDPAAATPRRREYSITARGLEALRWESRRLATLVAQAKRLGLVDGSSRS